MVITAATVEKIGHIVPARASTRPESVVCKKPVGQAFHKDCPTDHTGPTTFGQWRTAKAGSAERVLLRNEIQRSEYLSKVERCITDRLPYHSGWLLLLPLPRSLWRRREGTMATVEYEGLLGGTKIA